MIKKILVFLTIFMLMPFTLAEGETTTEPTTQPSVVTNPVVQEPVKEVVPTETTQSPTTEAVPTATTPIPSEQPVPVPEGCSSVTDSRGLQITKCPTVFSGQICPSGDQLKIKTDECTKYGGRPEKHSDSQGCTFISCSFGEQSQSQQLFPPQQQVNCPSSEEMGRVKEKCSSLGMVAVLRRSGECSFVECEGAQNYRLMPQMVQESQQAVRVCKPLNDDPKQQEECNSKGGKLMKRFDPQGCTFIECMQENQAQQFCQKDVPKEFFEKCTQNGGEPVSKKNDKGCVVFFNCLKRGDTRAVGYEEIQEVPPAAKILEAVLKMERLKMQLSKLEGELESIAKYYESNNNKEEADKFYRAAGMITSSQDKISSIKDNLRKRAAQLTVQDVQNTKADIKYITEVLFKDVLYVILGAEGTTETSKDVNGMVECGSDKKCFEENFRICRPSKFAPSGEKLSTTISIFGLNNEDKTCKLRVEQEQMGDMTCFVPDYAFARLEKESLLSYCKGSLVDVLKKLDVPQMAKSTSDEPIRKESKDMRKEEVRNFEQPVIPERPVDSVPTIQAIPVQPLPPGFSSQMPEPVSQGVVAEVQEGVASTGFAIRSIIGKMTGGEQ